MYIVFGIRFVFTLVISHLSFSLGGVEGGGGGGNEG